MSIKTIVDKVGSSPGIAKASKSSALTPARIVAFWSAVGSVGRTTTALNLAARAAKECRVLFVDLDFVAPSVALLTPDSDLPSLSTVLHHHQVTQSVEESFVHEFAQWFDSSRKSFRVIAGISRPERWQEIEPLLLHEMLKELSPYVDLIVCDLQASAHKLLAVNAVARSMLVRADAVVALANANPLGLARLLREIHELRALRAESDSVHVVFNQLQGRSNQVTELAAFVELTKLPAPMTIRDDHDAFELLVARASTKSTMRRRSAYKTDIQALTDKVLGL